MEVSASSEDALQLSSGRKNETSAPVFVFPSMHKLYKITLFLFFSMGAHWIWFTASFHDVHCASVSRALHHETYRPQYFHARSQMLITALRLQDRWICHGQKKERKKKEKNLSQILRNLETRNPEYKITANHILQIYYFFFFCANT